MLDFIYDSLDTVKKLKFPTVKQFAQLTGAIFGLVLIAWIYFIICDTIFSEGYKMFYASMTNWAEVVVDDENADVVVDGENTGDSGITFDYEPVVEETTVDEATAEPVAEVTAEPVAEEVAWELAE